MDPPNNTAAPLRSTPSYDTALCLIPPRESWESIDSVRSHHDKAWPRWPPHINLIYPFVEQDMLPATMDILDQLQISHVPSSGMNLSLLAVDTFVHKKKNIVYARPAEGEGVQFLLQAARTISRAMGLPLPGSFQPHMTMAQSQHTGSHNHQGLIDTVRQALPLVWNTLELSILVRCADGAMRLWGSVNLETRRTVRHETPRSFYSETQSLRTRLGSSLKKENLQPGYSFSNSSNTWLPTPLPVISQPALAPTSRVIVASMNVSDYSIHGQSQQTLLEHLLGARAVADVLLLQEATDSLLSDLLSNDGFRGSYPHCTHAPLQETVQLSPVPEGIAILSKWPLQWLSLDLGLEVDGINCLMATFQGIRLGMSPANGKSSPLAIVGCHFTSDTSDEVIDSRAQAMQRIVATLESNYRDHAWVIGGDLGLTTSLPSIRQARSRGFLTDHGQAALRSFDRMLQDLGVQDAWMTTRLGMGESSDLDSEPWFGSSLDEGEQASTCVAIANTEIGIDALSISDDDNQMTARPQRNARILLHKQSPIQPKGFNLFGAHRTANHVPRHRGMRSLLALVPSSDDVQLKGDPNQIEFQRSPSGLASSEGLQNLLSMQGLQPGPFERAVCAEALATLERILLGSQKSSNKGRGGAAVKLILATSGPFGLGVWSGSSTVNCLCIGNITSNTFFALATQRLKKELGRDVSSLRRGRGSTGLKFELVIQGIKFDLHYCAAAALAEMWPEVMKRPSFDPVFSLPFDTMMPLKPLRDTSYLLKSIPDMTQYRLAHAAIRAWAKGRGLFDATAGMLGDVHITTLLVPVCKLIAFNGFSGSIGDLVTTFFHHYAMFDWETRIVYDPFFHANLSYRRGFREPICLLGWHPPALNTATGLTSSVVKALAAELRTASERLSDPQLTWSEFLGHRMQPPRLFAEPAAAEFLKRYAIYIKVEARYWGPSSAKLCRFIHKLKLQCARTVLDIDKKVPSLQARIWPTAFVEESAIQQSTGREHHVHYLIGLAAAASNPAPVDNTLEGFLSAVAEGVERPMGQQYDMNTCWIKAYVVKSTELGSLRLDQNQSDMDTNTDEIDSDDCDSLSDDDEADGSVEEEEGSQQTQVGVNGDYEGGISGDAGRPTGEVVTRLKEQRLAQLADPGASTSASPAETEPNRGLRSAADVISRLRWDPDLDVSDYVVGYVDRFRGPQEKLLEQWKSDQTDEEFIPQHRILYFKRKEDSTVVWDRKLRIDKVFGSGR